MPKFFDNFYILGYLFSHCFDVLKVLIKWKDLNFCAAFDQNNLNLRCL